MPITQIRVFLALALLALIVGGGWYAHHRIYQSGYADAEAKWEKREADAAIVAATKLADANKKVLVTQNKLTDTLASIDAKTLELQHAKAQLVSFRTDLRASAVRLSIPVASGACRAAGEANSSTVTGGAGTETRAELLPETAGRLIDLVSDANDEVRRTNECIDRYEAVRAAVNLK